MGQWWIARWWAARGIYHEYHFEGGRSEEVTRAKFAINLFLMGYTLPDDFTLERAETREAGKWTYPVLKILNRPTLRAVKN